MSEPEQSPHDAFRKSKPGQAESAARSNRPARPPNRPDRPTLASPRPGGVESQQPIQRGGDALEELAAIAGSGVAPSTYVPSPTLDALIRRPTAGAQRSEPLAELMLPPLLVLGLTLPLLGIGWFLLDPTRVIRTTPLGVGVPILLFLAGAASLAGVAFLLMGTRRAGTKVDAAGRGGGR